MRKRSLKNIKILFAVLTSLVLTTVQPISVRAQESNLSKPNYLVPDENYYKNSEITKGDLDAVINENVPKLIESANNGKISFTEGMTYNEFFLANNIALPKIGTPDIWAFIIVPEVLLIPIQQNMGT
ncbi:hypothetical protein MGH68_18490 [Erysipelothrix sp. D19-032]